MDNKYIRDEIANAKDDLCDDIIDLIEKKYLSCSCILTQYCDHKYTEGRVDMRLLIEDIRALAKIARGAK